MSRVGVWLNNYGNAQHLPGALTSVLKQTFTDFTLYVFDNNSLDPDVAEIIARFAVRDVRVVPVPIPLALNRRGIPSMDFAWRWLNNKGHDYTITLGGHDFWADADHLEVLVKRMDAELQMRGPEGVAILYNDTWQVNEAGETIGRFQSIIQPGQVLRHFLPLVVITTVDSPQLFGLWNEKVRRKVPMRYQCGGWDHLIVMNAALYGSIMYEPGARLVMRCPPPGDCSEKYGQRHFSDENLARGAQDFIDQLEWCVYCTNLATEEIPVEGRATFRMMLTAAIVDAYCVLRGTNLMQIPGAYQAFTCNPLTIEMMKGGHHTYRMVHALIKNSRPQT